MKGLTAKTAWVTEGKTPEEIQQSMGEKFKMEGDKLKHFITAIEVANQNQDRLSRILVASLNEGEKIPPKAEKIEEHYYIPEFQVDLKALEAQKAQAKAADSKGGRKGRKDGPKESPWGLSPEQKAAKKGGGNKAVKADS